MGVTPQLRGLCKARGVKADSQTFGARPKENNFLLNQKSRLKKIISNMDLIRQ
jgi:hypothetical protein